MKPICTINYIGDKIWYLNGLLHRTDGPAIEFSNGDKSWYLNGLRHREDGPAYEGVYGLQSWYYHGSYIYCKDNQEFLRIVKLKMFF
tara:strand:+ start:2082 stop:2342 length:261 start_codon:yes stop_codon:yes gene_type:complete